jgi:hypothetical protein
MWQAKARLHRGGGGNGVLPILQCRFSNPRALVMPGLDPGIHRLQKMDCRIKSGNDGK